MFIHHHHIIVATRCLERVQAADSEREEAAARLRMVAEETADLKGKANYADSLRVSRVARRWALPDASELHPIYLR